MLGDGDRWVLVFGTEVYEIGGGSWASTVCRSWTLVSRDQFCSYQRLRLLFFGTCAIEIGSFENGSLSAAHTGTICGRDSPKEREPLS